MKKIKKPKQRKPRAPPSKRHKSKKDYDRKDVKKTFEKALEQWYNTFKELTD